MLFVLCTRVENERKVGLSFRTHIWGQDMGGLGIEVRENAPKARIKSDIAPYIYMQDRPRRRAKTAKINGSAVGVHDWRSREIFRAPQAS